MTGNILRDLFSPRCVVGLHVRQDRVTAVQVRGSMKGVEADRLVLREASDPASMEEALRRVFEEEKLRSDFVISAFPASRSLIREITLRFTNPGKIDKVIKFQMEPLVPHPIEELVVDFLEPAPDEPVLGVAVHKKDLSAHLDMLHHAGIEPERITPECSALLSLFRHTHSGDTTGPVAILLDEKDERSFYVVNEQRIDFVRNLSVGDPDWREVLDSVLLYRLKGPDQDIGKILLCGRSGATPGNREAIEEKTGIRTVVWRPFDAVNHTISDIPEEQQAEMCVPLGLALGAFQRPAHTCNLRKEDFRLRGLTDLARPAIFMISVLFFLAVLFGFDLHRQVKSLSTRSEALQGQILNVFRETFPGTARIMKGQEVAQMRQKIVEAKSQYQGLGDFAVTGRTLDLLLILNRALSKKVDVRIETLTMEGETVRIEGITSSFEGVDRMKKELELCGCCRTVKLIGAKTGKKSTEIAFSFALERNP